MPEDCIALQCLLAPEQWHQAGSVESLAGLRSRIDQVEDGRIEVGGDDRCLDSPARSINSSTLDDQGHSDTSLVEASLASS